MRVLALVDGEHYPSVTRWGLDVARSRGFEVLGALFLGGTEKVDPRSLPELGVKTVGTGTDQVAGLREAMALFKPEGVLDLSDEPVLGYRERMGLISVALAAGIPYLGADFRFDPPAAGPPLAVPTIAVIGTGKRTGKTAIGGALARRVAERGLRPVVVAMGRGGPPHPQVAEAGSVTLDSLLERLDRGEHAASDFLEDALTSGQATVGARRAGGGLAGAPWASNAREAADVAVGQGADVVILEGSGSSIPPVAWDAGILVVPATAPDEYLSGYLGPYRLLRSDLVVVTMCPSPVSEATHTPLRTSIQRWRADARSVITDFEPVALGEVAGKRAFLATTAPEAIVQRHIDQLQEATGCTIVGHSAHLSDRIRLTEDMNASPDYEVLLTELKAAAVDVACRTARAADAEIVFLDNHPIETEGRTDMTTELDQVIDLARSRATNRGAITGAS